MRAVFQDFSLDAGMPVGDVYDFYILPMSTEPSRSLGEWMAAKLNRPPVVGDTVRLGSATFVVRELEGRAITRISLGIQA